MVYETEHVGGYKMVYFLTHKGFVCSPRPITKRQCVRKVEPPEMFRILTDICNGGMNPEQAVTFLEKKIAEAIRVKGG